MAQNWISFLSSFPPLFLPNEKRYIHGIFSLFSLLVYLLPPSNTIPSHPSFIFFCPVWDLCKLLCFAVLPALPCPCTTLRAIHPRQGSALTSLPFPCVMIDESVQSRVSVCVWPPINPSHVFVFDMFQITSFFNSPLVMPLIRNRYTTGFGLNSINSGEVETRAANRSINSLSVSALIFYVEHSRCKGPSLTEERPFLGSEKKHKGRKRVYVQRIVLFLCSSSLRCVSQGHEENNKPPDNICYYWNIWPSFCPFHFWEECYSTTVSEKRKQWRRKSYLTYVQHILHSVCVS